MIGIDDYIHSPHSRSALKWLSASRKTPASPAGCETVLPDSYRGAGKWGHVATAQNQWQHSKCQDRRTSISWSQKQRKHSQKINFCHYKIHRTFGKDLPYRPILLRNRINACISTLSIHCLRTWLCSCSLRELLVHAQVITIGFS